MPFHKGDYHDARHVTGRLYYEGHHLVAQPSGALIVEALGGIGRRGARCLRFLARRAKDRKRGRDGTRYSRFHPSTFLVHHLERIVTAAVLSDAAHIVDGIIGLKQRAHDLALAGDSDDSAA